MCISIFKRKVFYLISFPSVYTFTAKKVFSMYIAKKFQYRLAFQSTFNRFSNFSISINYRVSANHFGKREPGRGQFFVTVLFPVPRKMLLKAGRFPAAERCAPAISISRRLAAWRGSDGGEREGGGRHREVRGLAHSERLFSFLRAASLESRINHARSPGLLSRSPSSSRPPRPSHDSNPRPSPPPSAPVTDHPFTPSNHRFHLPSPPVYGAAADN